MKKIDLKGRIDSNNAPQIEQEIMSSLEGYEGSLVIDAKELEYISSAGLRVILRIRKAFPDISIINVSSEVHEILEMTGFTELMTVEKAYRVVSVEGCEVIGEGANGKVYRIDQDNVVKTYKNADALSEIRNERELARLALILGVPTAISYDVVRVGDSYGSVFELLDSRSFAKILAQEPERMDWCVIEYVDMLKKIHSITVPEGKLPDIKDKAHEWTDRIRVLLPDDLADKLTAMIRDIPSVNTMIHGDYHTKNIVLSGGEVMLIDMDTLSVGHPVFELAQMYSAFLGFSEYDHEVIKQFQGFDRETAAEFWNRSIRRYFGTEDSDYLDSLMGRIRILSYTRMLARSIKHNLAAEEKGRAEQELWLGELIELLKQEDSLAFDIPGSIAKADQLDIEACAENLSKVQDFVDRHLEAIGCKPKAQMQIDVAVEEIFINIASYAYVPGKGNAVVRVEVSEEPIEVTITFIDHGIPYDPLTREDPDITLSADERDIGGLGVFLTKEFMDDVTYEYKDGSNILRLKKKLD